MKRLKRKVVKLVEKGSYGSKWNKYFDIFIIALIILNVIAIFYESTPQSIEHENFLYNFELVSVIIFTIEYLMRLFVADITHTSKPRWKSYFCFIISPLPLIDLFSILPFYLPLIFAFDLRFLRLFRLIRFLRLLKIKRYSEPFDLMGKVIREKKEQLLLTLFVAIIVLLSSSAIIYYVENKHQPQVYRDMVVSLWWAIDSMTPVSLGKMFPVTTIGKLIGSILGIFGVALIALPAGIISAGFLQKINERKEKPNQIKVKCPHCNKWHIAEE